MDITTLALSKGYTDLAALGLSNIRVEGTKVIFTLKETGEEAIVTVPTPKDGISVTDVKVNNNNHLICTMSNGEIIDAGEIKVSGGGSAATDDDIIELLFDTDIISPIVDNDGKYFIDNDGKIFIY